MTICAKSSNESPFRLSAFGMRLKKQFGISFKRRFLLIHGAQPLLCFVGCKGQFKFSHVQNGLIFSINTASILSGQLFKDRHNILGNL